MHLTLFVPDLRWPDVGNPDAYDFSGNDVLARTLAAATRSQISLGQTDSWEGRLAAQFGFTDAAPPLAALRSLGDGHPITQCTLCADPVNLGFIQQTLVLSPIPKNTLSDPETQSLLESLNAEFAGEGHFLVTAHRHWYFIPNDAAANLPDLAACSRLAGRRIDADDTRSILGGAGLQWLNRIQMCLNQHPVNAAREAAGLPLINSLWPWGLGQLTTAPAQTYTQAIGDGAMLNGLCLATGTPLDPNGRFNSDADDNAHTVVAIRSLIAAVQQDDLEAWQAAIAQLVTDWISPALNALTNQRYPLESLTLISPGAQQETTWSLDGHAQGLRGNFFQRCLGIRPKSPALASLLGS